MRPSTKRALSLLGTAGLLLGSLAVYAVLLRPEYKVLIELRGQVAARLNLLREQQRLSASAQTLIAEYQSVAGRVADSLLLMLPDEESVSSLLNQLNAISQASGAVIQSADVNYLPVRPSLAKLSFVKSLGTLKVDIRVFGSYAGIKQFIQFLERNLRLMNVKNLDLSQAGKPDQDAYNVTLSVETYYQTK